MCPVRLVTDVSGRSAIATRGEPDERLAASGAARRAKTDGSIPPLGTTLRRRLRVASRIRQLSRRSRLSDGPKRF